MASSRTLFSFLVITPDLIMAVHIKCMVFWNLTPCSVVGMFQRIPLWPSSDYPARRPCFLKSYCSKNWARSKDLGGEFMQCPDWTPVAAAYTGTNLSLWVIDSRIESFPARRVSLYNGYLLSKILLSTSVLVFFWDYGLSREYQTWNNNVSASNVVLNCGKTVLFCKD